MNQKPDSAFPAKPSDPDRAQARPDAIGPSDSGQLPGGRVEGGNTGEQLAVNFDDDEIYSGTGHNSRRGGTTQSEGGDSAPLDTPAEQLSGSNEPRERNF